MGVSQVLLLGAWYQFVSQQHSGRKQQVKAANKLGKQRGGEGESF